jgi:hypothetical protein
MALASPLVPRITILAEVVHSTRFPRSFQWIASRSFRPFCEPHRNLKIAGDFIQTVISAPAIPNSVTGCNIVTQACPREAVSMQGQTRVIVTYVKLLIDNFK